MSIYVAIAEGVRREQQSEKIAGVVVGVVSKNKDDDGLGRVKVTFPWLSETEESQWARVAAPMAGYDKDKSKPRGVYFLPEVGDEVLVAFEQGDPDRPYVIGALWNGKDKPPKTNDDGKNNIRLIQSRSGHQIILDDTEGSEKIEIKDKTEKNAIVWDTASNTITISTDKDISLKAPQGKISLDAQEVTIKSSANTTVEASGTMTVKGSTVNIN
ncbi:MAG TPA: phage baseplate assembly protein V [Syntrophobacteria bacterium]|nr:phage baseplate assembly protein V [Syntrophobacteria bacterium]